MNPGDIVDKTEKGSTVVKSRDRELTPRLRSMLIMADGRQTVAQLQSAAAQVGAPDDFLQTLLDLGLVQLRTVNPSRGGNTARGGEPAAVAAAPALAAETRAAPPADAADAASRLRAAQKFMNDAVADALGVRAVFFTLKLERCFTREDLQALLPEFTRLLTKAKGEAGAAALEQRARALLR